MEKKKNDGDASSASGASSRASAVQILAEIRGGTSESNQILFGLQWNLSRPKGSDLSNSRWIVLFALFFMFFQLYAFVFTVDTWSVSNAGISNFVKGIQYPRLFYALGTATYPTYIGVFIALTVIQTFVFGFCLYIAIVVKDDNFDHAWVVYWTRILLTGIAKYGYVSVIGLHLSMLFCNSSGQMAMYNTYTCWNAQHTILAIFGAYSALVIFFLSLMISGTFISLDPSVGNILSGPGVLHEALQLVCYTLLAVGSIAFPTSTFWPIVQVVCFWGLLRVILTYLPYHHSWVNKLQAGFYAVLLQSSLIALIGHSCIKGGAQETPIRSAMTVLVFVLAPLAFGLGYGFAHYRLRKYHGLHAYRKIAMEGTLGSVNKIFREPYHYEIATRFIHLEKGVTESHIELVDNILMTGVNEHKRSAMLRLLYSIFLTEIRGNLNRAETMLTEAKSLDGTLLERFLINMRDLFIKERQHSKEQRRPLDAPTVLCREYLHAVAALERFEKIQYSFFRALSSKQVQPDKVRSIIEHIASNRSSLTHMMNRLLMTHTAAIHVLRLYGRFLSIVNTDADASNAFYAEADRLENEKKNEIYHRSLFDVNLDQIDDVVDRIITIDRFGVIQRITVRLARTLGFEHAQELIGQNVSNIVPPPHNINHDLYLKRYHDGSKSQKVVNRERVMCAQHADGHTFPVKIFVSAMNVTNSSEAYAARIVPFPRGQREPDDIANEIPSCAANADGELASFNRPLMNMLRATPADLKGKFIWTLFPSLANLDTIYDIPEEATLDMAFGDVILTGLNFTFELAGSSKNRMLICNLQPATMRIIQQEEEQEEEHEDDNLSYPNDNMSLTQKRMYDDVGDSPRVSDDDEEHHGDSNDTSPKPSSKSPVPSPIPDQLPSGTEPKIVFLSDLKGITPKELSQAVDGKFSSSFLLAASKANSGNQPLPVSPRVSPGMGGSFRSTSDRGWSAPPSPTPDRREPKEPSFQPAVNIPPMLGNTAGAGGKHVIFRSQSSMASALTNNNNNNNVAGNNNNNNIGGSNSRANSANKKNRDVNLSPNAQIQIQEDNNNNNVAKFYNDYDDQKAASEDASMDAEIQEDFKRMKRRAAISQTLSDGRIRRYIVRAIMWIRISYIASLIFHFCCFGGLYALTNTVSSMKVGTHDPMPITEAAELINLAEVAKYMHITCYYARIARSGSPANILPAEAFTKMQDSALSFRSYLTGMETGPIYQDMKSQMITVRAVSGDNKFVDRAVSVWDSLQQFAVSAISLSGTAIRQSPPPREWYFMMFNGPTVIFDSVMAYRDASISSLDKLYMENIGLIAGAWGVEFLILICVILFGFAPLSERVVAFRAMMMRIYLSIPRGTSRSLSKKKEELTDWTGDQDNTATGAGGGGGKGGMLISVEKNDDRNSDDFDSDDASEASNHDHPVPGTFNNNAAGGRPHHAANNNNNNNALTAFGGKGLDQSDRLMGLGAFQPAGLNPNAKAKKSNSVSLVKVVMARIAAVVSSTGVEIVFARGKESIKFRLMFNERQLMLVATILLMLIFSATYSLFLANNSATSIANQIVNSFGAVTYWDYRIQFLSHELSGGWTLLSTLTTMQTAAITAATTEMGNLATSSELSNANTNLMLFDTSFLFSVNPSPLVMGLDSLHTHWIRENQLLISSLDLRNATIAGNATSYLPVDKVYNNYLFVLKDGVDQLNAGLVFGQKAAEESMNNSAFMTGLHSLFLIICFFTIIIMDSLLFKRVLRTIKREWEESAFLLSAVPEYIGIIDICTKERKTAVQSLSR